MCKICNMIATKFNLVYDDNYIICAIATERAAKGHLIVAPKLHYPIMEQVPEDILSRCFLIADRISMILTETIQSDGFNILINNGITAGQKESHFSINIIPRKIEDGLNFEWKTKEMDQDMLLAANVKVKEAIEKLSADLTDHKENLPNYTTRRIP